MSNGIARKIIVLAALAALGGCAGTSIEAQPYSAGKPILSAADGQALIKVKVTAIEPIDIDNSVAALMDDDSLLVN